MQSLLRGKALFFNHSRDSSVYPCPEQETLQMFCLSEQRLFGQKLRKDNECSHAIPGCCYRALGQAKKVGWEMFLQIREVCKTARTLIMRDFNYSAIDWDSHDAEAKWENGFPEVMQDCHLTWPAEQPSLHSLSLHSPNSRKRAKFDQLS